MKKIKILTILAFVMFSGVTFGQEAIDTINNDSIEYDDTEYEFETPKTNKLNLNDLIRAGRPFGISKCTAARLRQDAEQFLRNQRKNNYRIIKPNKF